MAVTMEGRFLVPFDRATVWAGLNDPAVLKRCINGCELFEKTSDTTFVASARMKLGPLSTAIKGRIALQDIDAPTGCRIVGEGEGGFAGFAKGSANLRLIDVPEGTAVLYDVEANVGGRIAKLGGRLIDGVALRLADKFFTAFAAALASPPRTPADRLQPSRSV